LAAGSAVAGAGLGSNVGTVPGSSDEAASPGGAEDHWDVELDGSLTGVVW